MAIVLGHFERVAELVAERISDILSAQVSVTNEQGYIVASSMRNCVGRFLGRELAAFQEGREIGELRVPFELDAQTGEVIVEGLADDEVISPRLARVLVDLVINQTLVVARLPDARELKDRFIHTLLRGTVGDEAEMLREGQVLGMDLTLPRAVILVDASQYILTPQKGQRPEVGEAEIHRRAQVVIASIVQFFSLPNDTICAYIGNGEVAVLKAASSHDLVDWMDWSDSPDDLTPELASASWANLSALKRAAAKLLAHLRRETGASISVGIGRYHPGIRGLARSYQDAQAALSLGHRLQVHGPDRVHCLDGLGIAAFVGVPDERTKIDLATHLLSPLDHEDELLETLDVFFHEDCCPSTTASRLSIHRNTLAHRLEKITALVGLDPRHFDDAVQIRLALLLRALRGAPA